MTVSKKPVAVITGAASGIGRATAEVLAEAGFQLHLVDISVAGLAELARAFRMAGHEVFEHQVDCRDPQALQNLASEVERISARVDLLFNNAGVGHLRPIEDTPLEDWQWVLELNLMGVIYGIQAFLPLLLRQGGFSLIANTASMAGLLGVPRMAPYCASKFALVGLSESLDIELADRGIRVAAICPGLMKTNIGQAARGGFLIDPSAAALAAEKAETAELFAKLGGNPREVGQAVLSLFLARRGGTHAVAGGLRLLWALKRLSHWAYAAFLRTLDRIMIRRMRRRRERLGS